MDVLLRYPMGSKNVPSCANGQQRDQSVLRQSHRGNAGMREATQQWCRHDSRRQRRVLRHHLRRRSRRQQPLPPAAQVPQGLRAKECDTVTQKVRGVLHKPGYRRTPAQKRWPQAKPTTLPGNRRRPPTENSRRRLPLGMLNRLEQAIHPELRHTGKANPCVRDEVPGQGQENNGARQEPTPQRQRVDPEAPAPARQADRIHRGRDDAGLQGPRHDPGADVGLIQVRMVVLDHAGASERAVQAVA